MLLCLLNLWQSVSQNRLCCAVLGSILGGMRAWATGACVCVPVGLQVASSGVRVLDSSKGWQLCSQWTPTGVRVCARLRQAPHMAACRRLALEDSRQLQAATPPVVWQMHGLSACTTSRSAPVCGRAVCCDLQVAASASQPPMAAT